jgi:hypothetical protein
MSPIGFVHGLKGEKPLLMSFHDRFTKGSLLTVCWNSGIVSHIPLEFDSKANKSMYSNGTPRSLTSFCISSPNSKNSLNTNSTPLRGTPLKQSNKSPLIQLNSNDSVLSPKRPLLYTTLTKRNSSYDSIE